MNKEKVSDRYLAQIQIEDTDGNGISYLYLNDYAIDALIEALKNAKTK
jgi:hypothetical protein